MSVSADARGDHRAPVAALRDVARVAEPLHQLASTRGRCARRSSPCASACRRSRSRAATGTPRGTRRRASPPCAVGSVSGPITFVELDDRAGPAVRHHQRQRVRRAASARAGSGCRGRRSRVRNCGKRVQPRCARRQSYCVGPVGARPPARTRAGCPATSRPRLGVGPARRAQARAQVVESSAVIPTLKGMMASDMFRVSVLPWLVFVPKPTRGRPGLSLQPCNLASDHLLGGPILASTVEDEGGMACAGPCAAGMRALERTRDVFTACLAQAMPPSSARAPLRDCNQA